MATPFDKNFPASLHRTLLQRAFPDQTPSVPKPSASENPPSKETLPPLTLNAPSSASEPPLPPNLKLSSSQSSLYWKNLLLDKNPAAQALPISLIPSAAESVVFSEEELLEGSLEWNMSLVGYSLGRRPYYGALLDSMKKLWKLKDEVLCGFHGQMTMCLQYLGGMPQ